ncbi:hypothetical protein [Actinokineospora globicatena]|uniref:PH domain-containing protein n=1 Tax=Actinokineospora globicatena TaxID=103729 RepID=A0A9W6QTD2_9PSEU|nr:hypothetical protein [Actinokineospora globicatena]GLW95895.1 hypothetical protein Aglo03_67110 [Actinokineospora globicatena]
MDRVHALPCPQPWRKTDGSPNPAGAPTGAAATVETEGAAGLLLPTRPATVAAGVVLVLIGLALAVPGGLLIAGGGGLAVFAGVVLGLLGLLLLAAGVFALTRKQGDSGIVLTPEHVVLTWVRPVVRVPWTTITEVRPLALRVGRTKGALSQNYLGLAARDHDVTGDRMRKVAVRFGPDLVCAVPMRTLDLDQLVVLHALRFYLANPQHRAELAGEDAVRRVESGPLTAS